MVTKCPPFREFLVELLTHLWLEMEVGQQEEKVIGQTCGFSLWGFLTTILFSVCGIFGNEFLQPEGGPRAPGKRKAELSPPHQAEGKVQGHEVTEVTEVTVEWLGEGGRAEGEREAGVPLSDPEKQRSEQLEAP